ncbi:hypothetical protein HMN09_00754800 [Mycena chlorophos]|uniref:Xylanolytic transcriptional activator regulatory domain-containing protein n=1 Tax=Mycena chlorophos TaxID=658473 RepID=A0A8H6W8W9_MYCCL|nr:hypothetical protein HMN09_00754800 [Mycena chlorophos]
MEALLRKLLPGIDFTEHLENDTDIEPLIGQSVDALPRNDADNIVQTLSKLQLNPDKNRFFGKSSGIQLVQVALNFQSDLTGIVPEVVRNMPLKRAEFWSPALLWEMIALNTNFPEPALMQTLIDLYFQKVNPFYPVLHQPTFRTDVASELHLRDHRFAATLLMVCSLGARHSEDPRVLLDDSTSRHAAGWKWYSQVRVLPKHLIYKPDICELQTYALSGVYLQGISSTAVGWNLIGFGLRRAQDVGAHRKRKDAGPSSDNEKWKRVFWALLCQEYEIGTLTGRPVAIHEQDFDQDYPIECDDEYWDKPGPDNFRQPPEKPSQLTYFNCLLKLLEIQAAVTGSIYCTRKPTDVSGVVSAPSDAQSIMAFDSALNAWLSKVPPHLRWDPERKDPVYFQQSALLHAKFYYVQILVHRPFIPSPLEPSRSGTLPSLAICTSAARSCVGIFEALLKRKEIVHSFFLVTAFTAGIVLLLNAWSGRRSGFAYNPAKELEQVGICLTLIRSGESKYRTAGRYADILLRLMHAGARDTLEMLLDLKPPAQSVVPPSPQPGYEAYSVQEGDWSSPFVGKGATAGTGAAGDFLVDNADGLLTIGSPYALQESVFTVTGQPMFEPALNMEMDPNILAMWSTAPSGFNVEDWSYVMAEESAPFPQFEPIPVPGVVETDGLRKEASCFWS